MALSVKGMCTKNAGEFQVLSINPCSSGMCCSHFSVTTQVIRYLGHTVYTWDSLCIDKKTHGSFPGKYSSRAGLAHCKGSYWIDWKPPQSMWKWKIDIIYGLTLHDYNDNVLFLDPVEQVWQPKEEIWFMLIVVRKNTTSKSFSVTALLIV